MDIGLWFMEISSFILSYAKGECRSTHLDIRMLRDGAKRVWQVLFLVFKLVLQNL